ncbi:glycogen debranching protein GlgX [Psychromonas sp. B3M02]|uniref:glycogen debranching protein GlgX n=1 Tax=Psychromonas sp. B3M02 TaxID=2267226 RepID=UPI00215D9352|nr:glycogen debranching protein GlgX [Psychromonas sp. B3M02]
MAKHNIEIEIANPHSQQSLFSASKGQCFPLGATLDEQGCNFAVHSQGGTSVELCLFDKHEKQIASYPLTSSHSHLWHVYLTGIKAGQAYGYRVDGEFKPANGLFFNKNNLLIDPYAKALSKVQHSFVQAQSDLDDNFVAKSLVVDDSFDWQGTEKPNINAQERILYELHAKGFTQSNTKIPLAMRGKYLGLSHPESIKHYQSLGVTSLQIMPVFSFMSEPRLSGLSLTNYWGYNPINFFSPERRYSQYDAVNEFKTMVKELHAANIEVILDVVFNHTAESGKDGLILSFKGLDNRHYYCFESTKQGVDFQRYSNHSGCGNTVNLDFAWSLKITLDSLRYWVTEMQVDGFRFDLAVTLAREAKGFTEHSAFFKTLMQDPVLSQVVLIAEPWDIGPGGYRLGAFPEQWKECNDRYRDTMRSFWRGDTGKVSEVATRLLGSHDFFPAKYRSNSTSVNYICYHDGFTLDDLVSFQERHNQANGENNRDGHGHNLSANYGFEGPTEDERINRLRQQQKRNMIATLFLSQGTPHFLSGDEMGNHQSGNNNAYCQDNQISWINWDTSEDDQALLAFTSKMIALRAESRLFGDLILDDHNPESDIVAWYHPDGYLMEEVDWHATNSQAIALSLKEASEEGEHWYLILNASTYQIACELPKLATTKTWCKVLDTSCATGELVDQNAEEASVHAKAHSTLLFKVVNSSKK